MVEIEAKFRYGPAEAERIARLANSSKSKQTVLRDQYWDKRPLFPLTTRDLWLRSRNNAWELKVPHGLMGAKPLLPSARETSAVDQYLELTTASDIWPFLLRHGLVADVQSTSTSNLASLLGANQFHCFADIVTNRRTYQFAEANIVLDEANGYCVGELELLLPKLEATPEACHKANERLFQLAKELGVSLQDAVPGKVLHHIRQKNTDHWRALARAGLLRQKGVPEV
jgi:adenylate cyclase class IV